MSTLQEILENTTIDYWARHFRRTPLQLNILHQSDAEIIEIPGSPDLCLAATIDTVSEEIALNIYREPYTMGWITVMASLSDLAAVGADPLGMLIAVSTASNCDRIFMDGVARGMEDACRSQGVFILGGDTNESAVTSLTGCALGTVPRRYILSRKGCNPRDAVFTTGGMGAGNALGLVRIMNLPDAYFSEGHYRPSAALKQGRIIREFASCCMDTSDGLLTTLDQLMRINGVGFEIECDWNRILAPQVFDLCIRTNTQKWMMIAGPHGEFELVFTVSQNHVQVLQEAFERENLPLIHLGNVRKQPELILVQDSVSGMAIDMTVLRNLYHNVQGDLRKYVEEFSRIGEQWGVERNG